MQVIAAYSNARIGTKILCVFNKGSLRLSTEGAITLYAQSGKSTNF